MLPAPLMNADFFGFMVECFSTDFCLYGGAYVIC